MASWLFKQEPKCYSIADLERDRTTVWDGVKNALALKHLRQTRPGERVWFYHTGKEKAIVGEMLIVEKPHIPESDASGVAVTVAFVRRLSRPVGLAEIKADKQLAAWDLVRLPRLSVVPVPLAIWLRVEELFEK